MKRQTKKWIKTVSVEIWAVLKKPIKKYIEEFSAKSKERLCQIVQLLELTGATKAKEEW